MVISSAPGMLDSRRPRSKSEPPFAQSPVDALINLMVGCGLRRRMPVTVEDAAAMGGAVSAVVEALHHAGVLKLSGNWACRIPLLRTATRPG